MAGADRSAELWGFDVTHLDSHLGGVELKPEFFDVYLELADELRLPVRLPGAEEERRVGFPFRELAAERDVLAPDHVMFLSTLAFTRRSARLDLEPRASPRSAPVRRSTRRNSAAPRTGRRGHRVTTLLCPDRKCIRAPATRPIASRLRPLTARCALCALRQSIAQTAATRSPGGAATRWAG